ncbi:hypothetical protein chiPu_0025632 [Chiloscyllium punctatum]|uniref:Uncharacterized protein n=1 Tax=Chiloscyllium punctatum TaxID=137246 RepID=A0A401TH52_CHIPU|nr:hypothetical protein [Chiloscyllium punctatum]
MIQAVVAPPNPRSPRPLVDPAFRRAIGTTDAFGPAPHWTFARLSLDRVGWWLVSPPTVSVSSAHCATAPPPGSVVPPTAHEPAHCV